ncbi:MAG: hypothetical protein SOW13_08395 [Sodaliphilus sp.]|nr:hypothetical protein [Sodaliphilus sp.]
MARRCAKYLQRPRKGVMRTSVDKLCLEHNRVANITIEGACTSCGI